MSPITSNELDTKFLHAFGLGQALLIRELKDEIENLKIYTSDPDPDINNQSTASVWILQSMMDCYNGHIDIAIESLFTALRFFPSNDIPSLRATFLSMISWMYHLSGTAKESKVSLKLSNNILDKYNFPIIKVSNLFTAAVIQYGELRFSKIIEIMKEADVLAGELSMSAFSLIARNNMYWDLIPFEPFEKLEQPLVDLVSECKNNFPQLKPVIFSTLAYLYQFHGRYEMSIELYEDIFDSNQLNIPHQEIEISLLFADALTNTGDFENAKKRLLVALSLSRQFDINNFLPTIHKNLANVYTLCGDETKALDHLIDHHNIEEKIRNSSFLIKTIDLSLFSEPINRNDLQPFISMIGIDPQTGLLDRTRFISTANSLLVNGMKDQTIMLIRLSEGHIYKPRSLPTILSVLSLTIKSVIDVEHLACRYTKNEIAILLPNTGSETAKVIGERIFAEFFEGSTIMNEPWVSAFLNMGIIQGTGDELWIIESIDRLERELQKKIPMVGGQVTLY